LADLNLAIQLAPDDPDALTQRGNLEAERGNFGDALGDFEQALSVDSEWAEAHRSLAWLRATCPDSAYRDTKQALSAAKEAQRLAPPDDPFVLDALAAAHASAGDFEEAVRVQQQAIATSPPDFVEPLRQRLNLYQQGQPFLNEPVNTVRAASHEASNAKEQQSSRTAEQ
jgi:tetratricopeptide (TPR) repeat protein